MSDDLQILLPAPSRGSTVAEAYGAPITRVGGRPTVGLCMVASIDGSTVIDGRSGQLSSETDSAILHQLRSIADVVLVGAGTVRGEGYGRPRKTGQRIGVVTSSGSVDVSSELFASGAGFVITTTTTDLDPTIERDVDVIRAGVDGVDLAGAIGQIPSLCPGVTYIQAEGGPSLNGSLAEAGLLDELNLTTSSALIGGAGPRLVDGAGDLAHRYELAQLAVDGESFVFSRWVRRPVQTSP
jgi:riboflavin biosynthesis pyrimidine reductase